MAKLTINHNPNNPTVQIGTLTEFVPGVQPLSVEPTYIDREVVVEKIVYVDKPIEIIKEVEKIIEKPIEIIKEIEKKVEVINEVEKIIEKPIEIIKEVEILVDKVIEKEKIITKVPAYIWYIMAVQTALILFLIVK